MNSIKTRRVTTAEDPELYGEFLHMLMNTNYLPKIDEGGENEKNY